MKYNTILFDKRGFKVLKILADMWPDRARKEVRAVIEVKGCNC